MVSERARGRNSSDLDTAAPEQAAAPEQVARPRAGRAATIPSASVLDAARVLGTVVAPVVTGGAVARRPRAMLATERAGLDKHAVATMQHLRHRYGPGPVQVRLPGRRFTFLLEPDQVHPVLNESPDPFATATREKRGALGRRHPGGALISSPDRKSVV